MLKKSRKTQNPNVYTGSDDQKRYVIAQMALNVESVVSLRDYTHGQDQFADRGMEILKKLESDLETFRLNFALNIAFNDLERLAREKAHEDFHAHYPYDHTCPICSESAWRDS